MDKAFEALMKDMLNQGWFAKSNGDVESPLGYYGYVTNTKYELSDIRQAFSETIGFYGDVPDEDLIGSFFANINSNGIIYIYRKDNDDEARRQYELHNIEYSEWLDK